MLLIISIIILLIIFHYVKSSFVIEKFLTIFETGINVKKFKKQKFECIIHKYCLNIIGNSMLEYICVLSLRNTFVIKLIRVTEIKSSCSSLSMQS